jgi:hypothetical protein
MRQSASLTALSSTARPASSADGGTVWSRAATSTANSRRTLRSFARDDTWIDAFYRTISLLVTGADTKGDQVDAGSWQKAFIISLKRGLDSGVSQRGRMTTCAVRIPYSSLSHSESTTLRSTRYLLAAEQARACRRRETGRYEIVNIWLVPQIPKRLLVLRASTHHVY